MLEWLSKPIEELYDVTSFQAVGSNPLFGIVSLRDYAIFLYKCRLLVVCEIVVLIEEREVAYGK